MIGTECTVADVGCAERLWSGTLNHPSGSLCKLLLGQIEQEAEEPLGIRKTSPAATVVRIRVVVRTG